MSIRTLLHYLIGNRHAILQIANCPKAFVVGFLFVLSAGLAREYDGEDLLNEPWHALIPVGASVGSSLILFLVTYGLARGLAGVGTAPVPPMFGALHDVSDGAESVRQVKLPVPPVFSAYISFVTLYWMTAPLAWLYAIPFERFLTPRQAMEANLFTLGVVASWRVLLMIRVVSVWMGYKTLHAIFLVMLFADALVLVAVSLVPVPLLDVMGGIRLSETEQVLRSTTCTLLSWGSCSLPIWVIGALVCIRTSRPNWSIMDIAPQPVSRMLWAVAAGSVAVWIFILPITQPEQVLRRRVERSLVQGQIGEALAEMSARDRADFPSHWSPPPHLSRYGPAPNFLDVLEAMVDSPSAPWVREIYFEKIPRYVESHHVSREADLKRLARVLEKFPDGKDMIEGLPRLKLMLEKQPAEPTSPK